MTTFSQTKSGGTVPTAYVKGPAPIDPTGQIVYLEAELAKVQTAFATLASLVPQAATKAPAKPIENMIRFAKAPWRPLGGTTDRMVVYVAGSWVALSSV